MASADGGPMVCHNANFYSNGTRTANVWRHGNPLATPSDVLFLQIFMITLLSQCINFCLRPLGQSSLVSQILGGILFGPSVLGKIKVLSLALFPAKANFLLETIAAFGVMYFFFLMGVKTDPANTFLTERKAVFLALSVFASALVFPTGLSIFMKKYVAMNNILSNALPYIACLQAFTGSAVIACFLSELKILNTDVGRLSLSLAMFGDLIGIFLTLILFSVLGNNGGASVTLIWILLSAFGLILFVAFVLRPLLLWMLVRAQAGNGFNEIYIVSTFALVLVVAFMSELIGQHYVIGPLLFGFAVPEGPPMGSAIISKLETLSGGLFYPTFLAVSGLHTNVFEIELRSIWVVGLIVCCSAVVKIGAVMISGYYINIPRRERLVIGLILNTKGITELVVYNLWKGNKMLSEQEFSLMVLSVILITAIVTPLVRYLYDPSEQYFSLRRSSIQHTKRDAELRVMVCVHNNEHVASMINLVEASYAGIDSPVAFIALVLVELLGRARPLLVAHQSHNILRRTSCNSSHICNALRQYEERNADYVSVQSFTSVSSFSTMYNDVCRIAQDRRANILIMPFHKHWEIGGAADQLNRGIQTLNIKVLERAPCSVGILIDRGIMGSRLSLLTDGYAFNVVVFYIGGADDAEALAYAARMARRENVLVTVARFLIFGEENSKERKRESDLISEYIQAHVGNPRFEVIDKVVRDGIDMSSCIRRIIDYFDLVLVGREHSESALLRGHDQWSECPELGVLGDMLASQDFITKASVLVVQQQRTGGMLVKQATNTPGPNERDQLVLDVPYDEGQKASWSITMDRQ
ncbi:hypothetical protein L6164_029782 [Bauhinia variegata]|uniref:Uncharacterized protein n=1 Tax=Bauhinia variegata TaxID=167791 RepID=A0ACB9LAQ8_BAUVA|nr:hypothetical protein L6164_029782 [Bauhinia variegata]